jgi:hypothetical protein
MKQQIIGAVVAIGGLLIVQFTGIDGACTNQITSWIVSILPVAVGTGVVGHSVAKHGALGSKLGRIG